MSENPASMVADFLHYNRWANLRLLDACAALTPAQLDLSAPGVYGDIYDTFVHIIRAEASYYRRLSGVRIEPPFAWDAAPSLAQMRPYADQIGAALVELAGRMQPTDSIPHTWTEHEWEGQPEHYKSVSLLIQILNHGVEHRTNITTILAQHALPSPGLDGWSYMLENPGRMGV